MLPTLHGDQTIQADYVWISAVRRDYSVRRGEVVAFSSPNDPDRVLIKRVIGLPGDVIKTSSYKQPVVKVREGSIWVEGDNRERSMDSNYFGPVPLGLVVGKATRIVWPPARWGKLDEDIGGTRSEINQVTLSSKEEELLQSLDEIEKK